MRDIRDEFGGGRNVAILRPEQRAHMQRAWSKRRINQLDPDRLARPQPSLPDLGGWLERPIPSFEEEDPPAGGPAGR